MSAQTENKEKKVAWVKGGLAAALAGVLAVVASQEFLASPKNVERDEAPIRPPLAANADDRAAAANQRPPKQDVRIELDQALERDPFRMPDAIQQRIKAIEDQQKRIAEKENEPKADEKPDHRAEVLQKLRQEGVSMIVQTDRGRAAMIGSRIVHEGDKIDGFVVVRISKDGIDLDSDKKQP